MVDSCQDLAQQLEIYQTEIRNFAEIFAQVVPTSGEIPNLPGIDIFGKSEPLNKVAGGDHIVYVDFNKRYELDTRIAEARRNNRHEIADRLEQNKRRAGILLADVSGHQITDALMAAMLHQAFLIGVQYELTYKGEVSVDLFENINTRFYNSSSKFKFLTMIYGEIDVRGVFRFISAAHPQPIVFSRKFDKIMPIGNQRMVNFPPIGTIPTRGHWEALCCSKPVRFKEKYAVREINLMGGGDILVLYSDGLAEHQREDGGYYFPERFEEVLSQVKDQSAREIYQAVKEDVDRFAAMNDDFSCVIIKKQ